MYAPQIDTVKERINAEHNTVSHDDYVKLNEIYDAFSIVKPGNDDNNRHTWLEVERGPIEAFGDYRELKRSGDVESRAEFDTAVERLLPSKDKVV